MLIQMKLKKQSIKSKIHFKNIVNIYTGKNVVLQT